MQSFIRIVHSVRPFSLFQNLELGTASTDVILQALDLDLSIVMGMQNYIKTYLKVQETGPFSPFQGHDNLMR